MYSAGQMDSSVCSPEHLGQPQLSLSAGLVGLMEQGKVAIWPGRLAQPGACKRTGGCWTAVDRPAGPTPTAGVCLPPVELLASAVAQWSGMP